MLNDLAREISVSSGIEEVMEILVRRSLTAVGGSQGVLSLVARGARTDEGTLVRARACSAEHPSFHLDDSVLGWMLTNKRVLTVNDPSTDERFSGVPWDGSIRSLISAPLLVKSELIGALTIYNKRSGRPFSKDDARLLAIVASQSAQVVENARLREDEEALLRMREELRLASEIQRGLLPDESPRLPGYDITGVSIPAREVGGDYFDFIRIDDRRLMFCLGDVSGKGLPAALLMSNLQASVRSQALSGCTSKECVDRSNKLLHKSTEPGKFVTFFCGQLDAETHELAYCNAGHDRPILVSRSSTAERLEPAGLVLSFTEDATYEEVCRTLDPGDCLVVYSDGISEAFDENDEEFGEERLVDLIESNAAMGARALADEILCAVQGHRGKQPQSDDMTLVVIRRNPR